MREPKEQAAYVAHVRLNAEQVAWLKRIIRHYDVLDSSAGIRKALEVTGKLLEKQAAKEKEGRAGTPE